MKAILHILLSGTIISLMTPLSLATLKISEVQINPTGSDTGNEYVILQNSSTGSSLYMDDWLLDVDKLPDIILPPVTLDPLGTFSVFLRKEGVSSNTELYTSPDFSTNNAANSKGFVALFHGLQKSSTTIRDYLSYGEPGQSFSSSAISAELWSENDVVLVTEGPPLTRTSWEHSPFAWTQTETHPSTGTGSLIINQAPMAVITLQGAKETSGSVPFIFNVTGEDSSDPENEELLFSWDFGNNIRSERKNPLSVTYEKPGTYNVILEVSDPHGLKDQKTLSISVSEKQSSSSSSSSHPSSSTNESCTPEPAQHSLLLISEIFPNPDGSDSGKEWIELYNNSATSLNLCGVGISDEATEKNPYIFQDTLIPAQSFYIFENNTQNISLNNNKDTVTLWSISGSILEQIEYTNAPSGQSFSRRVNSTR